MNSKPSSRAEKLEMTFDFEGLIQLLAGHLYSEKKVFIRELIQNCHDAIQRRASIDAGFDLDQGRIDILTDLTEGSEKITFIDNGLGMTRADLKEFLSTIGKSGTKAARGVAPEVIGQFGIGFLSGFVVGKRVDVHTRHWTTPPGKACRWENSGNKDYTITHAKRDAVGSQVVVHLASAADRALIRPDNVKSVIRVYADMLRIPIYVDDPNHHGTPINTRTMPWERTDITDEEMRLDGMIYLEKTVPDSVLEVIPVRERGEHGVRAEGLLYITRTRVIGRDVPRTVRVFLRRMFLCEDAKELLPPWATFVNGVINTIDLTPNAARDNFARGADNHIKLRDRLGDIIVSHFEHLKEKEPRRLSEILAYHDLGIKAACHYYDPFFDKFGHLLEWRINGKSAAATRSSRPAGRRVIFDGEGADHSWATLPEIIASLPQSEKAGPSKLACFTTRSSANQYFEMADAAGTTVVDASYPFETELIREWAGRHKEQITLVYVDREDDPDVFREIDSINDRDVQRLAAEMSNSIRPGGTGRVHVVARRFEPAALTAVLKDSEASKGARKARDIINDPNSTADLRAMAEEMLLSSRNANMRMTINAANSLVRTLAGLIARDPNDQNIRDLTLGLYNDAILYNQELLTPHNARIFHDQFQRLMRMAIEYISERTELVTMRAELERERQRYLRPGRSDRKYVVAFLMTPYRQEFEESRAAVRIALEDGLGCELRVADELTFEDFIRDNVRIHLDDADFFVADVTGANPNVMLELGAALHGQPGAPTFLMAGVPSLGDRPALPADLEGRIAAKYVKGQTAQEIADSLQDAFKSNARLQDLLNRQGRERFVSAGFIREATKNLLRIEQNYELLSRKFPTDSLWRSLKRNDLAAVLGEDADVADAIANRVLQRLVKS